MSDKNYNELFGMDMDNGSGDAQPVNTYRSPYDRTGMWCSPSWRQPFWHACSIEGGCWDGASQSRRLWPKMPMTFMR